MKPEGVLAREGEEVRVGIAMFKKEREYKS